MKLFLDVLLSLLIEVILFCSVGFILIYINPRTYTGNNGFDTFNYTAMITSIIWGIILLSTQILRPNLQRTLIFSSTAFLSAIILLTI
jgi:hypothetical protein